MSRLFKLVALSLVVVMLVTTVGCYGSFNLTKKVYKWNGTFGNKWVNEIGFLALNIIPVYSVASFVDVIVLNSIEFWTGKNPVMASADLPEQGASVTANTDDGSVTFVSRDGKMLTVTLTDNGAEVRDAEGTLLARSVRTTDGVTTYAPDGTQLGTMSNDQIAALVK